MQVATNVNAAGIREIAAFLAETHKLGGDHFTDDMLRAWAADAEAQLAEGNGASIEIRAHDAVTGRPEVFTVSDDGLDFAEVWYAWEDGDDEKVEFLVPLDGAAHDVAELGASALGVDVSEALNVERA